MPVYNAVTTAPEYSDLLNSISAVALPIVHQAAVVEAQAQGIAAPVMNQPLPPALANAVALVAAAGPLQNVGNGFRHRPLLSVNNKNVSHGSTAGSIKKWTINQMCTEIQNLFPAMNNDESTGVRESVIAIITGGSHDLAFEGDFIYTTVGGGNTYLVRFRTRGNKTTHSVDFTIDTFELSSPMAPTHPTVSSICDQLQQLGL